MKERIVENIKRLSLHDSILKKIDRIEDKLILTVDWAKIEDYTEKNIEEGLVLGNCRLTFYELNNESLTIDFRGTPGNENIAPKEIEFDIKLFKEWLILDNKSVDENKYCLNGLIDYENKYGWLDWNFYFSKFELSWNNYITWEEWRNGKIVKKE
ncbi:hypothetical protein [Aquimarina algicola]|uniref:Uncharacterized protein n=1 Tax=Aquimarina algicola TaxID=2589995 RepID=A0A504JCI2_9FLAO|nr:hypothetical protein [Aquimarina algicola]TPN86312.1 hypothetical protein FHK87_13680 [Aquimarina algicola]